MTDLTTLIPRAQRRLRWHQADRKNHQRLEVLSRALAEQAPRQTDQPPVVFFRASTGILHFSLNAAFGLLASWGLRLGGTPVVHFTCQAGMPQCVQGLNRQDYAQPPPCNACTTQALRTYAHAPVHWFSPAFDPGLEKNLVGLDLGALSEFEHNGLPLGRLVLPSLRWALRRHHLPDDEATRGLLRRFLLAAGRVAHEFAACADRHQPRSLVVFNGTFFPEAVTRWVARQRGIPVVSYEVGFRPFSAFFTHGQATAYPIDIPIDFELSPEQDQRLDAYLQARMRGDFTMAGIRFWPEMKGLDQAFLEKAGRFRQVVPVFTNVVFDTSQVHANTVFPQMFAWLDQVAELIADHPDTLFVLRAHPDEMRAGKQSRESVEAWARDRDLLSRDNVVFVPPDEHLSSYELIGRSKFVMVYNSSIGLEAALLGAAVVCAGQARYTQIPTAYLPAATEEHRRQCEAFLAAESLDVPGEFRRNARRFLYYQLYKTSLPFGEFLKADPRPGFVHLANFDWHLLAPERSATLRTILDGITQGRPFILEEG